MSELSLNCPPEEVGLNPERWARVLQRAEQWCSQGEIPSIALVVGRAGKATSVHRFGRQKVDHPAPLRQDAIFLVASITKPIVGSALLQLVEAGAVSLNDKVRKYIPEFKGPDKNSVTLRHCLTHTSGLPDMLPNDFELRDAHTPFSGFIENICQTEMLFTPGHSVRYQSMGLALIGEVLQRVSGLSYSESLQKTIFEPLQMHDTTLGAPDSWYTGDSPKIERVAEIRLPLLQQKANWNWNGKYWQQLGAPWGGLLTTPEDLARFATMMLSDGILEGVSILSPATIATATRNQLEFLPHIPEIERRCRPWGLGWKRHWPAHSAHFGDLLSPETYGHWGATGTLLWMDPVKKSFCIILSTEPQEPQGRYSASLSNGIAAAFH